MKAAKNLRIIERFEGLINTYPKKQVPENNSHTTRTHLSTIVFLVTVS